MTFTVGGAEVAAMGTLFGIAFSIATVIGNYFVLRSQVSRLEKGLEGLVRSVSKHGERLTVLEVEHRLNHNHREIVNAD